MYFEQGCGEVEVDFECKALIVGRKERLEEEAEGKIWKERLEAGF